MQTSILYFWVYKTKQNVTNKTKQNVTNNYNDKAISDGQNFVMLSSILPDHFTQMSVNAT